MSYILATSIILLQYFSSGTLGMLSDSAINSIKLGNRHTVKTDFDTSNIRVSKILIHPIKVRRGSCRSARPADMSLTRAVKEHL